MNDKMTTDARNTAVAAAREKIEEALAILAGPLADATEHRAALLTGARAATSAQNPAVREFAKADAIHARLENLIAHLTAAKNTIV